MHFFENPFFLIFGSKYWRTHTAKMAKIYVFPKKAAFFEVFDDFDQNPKNTLFSGGFSVGKMAILVGHNGSFFQIGLTKYIGRAFRVFS